MTDSPSIIPPQFTKTPTAHEIPQALHDSEINFKIESFYDGVWTATLGDHMNGWGSYSRRPNYVDALLDLKDMAIEAFPESAFARACRGVRFAEETNYENEDALLI
jgi:hypothetical protein